MKKTVEEKVILVDETGTPVEVEKKKLSVKGVLKAVGLGLFGAAAGIAAFCLVGLAMSSTSEDTSDESTIDDDGSIVSTSDEQSDSSGSESTEG